MSFHQFYSFCIATRLQLCPDASLHVGRHTAIFHSLSFTSLQRNNIIIFVYHNIPEKESSTFLLPPISLWCSWMPNTSSTGSLHRHQIPFRRHATLIIISISVSQATSSQLELLSLPVPHSLARPLARPLRLSHHQTYPATLSKMLPLLRLLLPQWAFISSRNKTETHSQLALTFSSFRDVVLQSAFFLAFYKDDGVLFSPHIVFCQDFCKLCIHHTRSLCLNLCEIHSYFSQQLTELVGVPKRLFLTLVCIDLRPSSTLGRTCPPYRLQSIVYLSI